MKKFRKTRRLCLILCGLLLLLCFSGLLSELLYFMNTHVFSAVTHLFLMMTGGA